MAETAGGANDTRTSGAKVRGVIRRWLIRAGAVAVAVVVIVRYRDIDHLANLWVNGKLTGDTIVWGLSTRTWGRIGKALQYVAGVTVILDIIGPKRLTALSDAWNERRGNLLKRAERQVEIFPLATLRREMNESIVFEEKYYSAATAETGIPSEMKVSRGGAPPVAGLSRVLRQADIDPWHAATVATLPTAHTCADRHGRPGERACYEQVRFVSSAVDEFLRVRLSVEDWVAMIEDSESGSLALRSRFLWLLSFVLMTPLLYVLIRLFGDMAANRTVTTVPGDLLLWAFISGFFAIGAASSAEATPSRSSLGVGIFRMALWIRIAPVSGLMRMLAKILIWARPTHALKWFAAGLALVGFGFDMFAS